MSDCVRILPAILLAMLAACGGPSSPPDAGDADSARPPAAASHTGTIALSPDERTLLVLAPDEDSLVLFDTVSPQSRRVRFGPIPGPDARGRYAPSFYPRALSLSADGARIAVALERSGEVAVVRASDATIVRRRRVCARPISAAFFEGDRGRSTVIATCAADEAVLALDGETLEERGRVRVSSLPWGLVVDHRRALAHVTHLHGPGTTTLRLSPSFSIASARDVAEVAPRGHRTLAHGKPRSLYDLALHPATGALWIAHELHGDDTAQPALDFESTVFAAVTIVPTDAREASATLSIDARLAGEDGAFGDVISGPRAVRFSSDGRLAFVVAQASEDVLVIDVARRVQVGLLRPLEGHWPQGIALTRDGARAFVDLRNTGNVAAIDLRRDGEGRVSLARPAALIELREADPMPSDLRLGQRVFFTANDTDVPVTTNRWMACASCHPEGTTNRITWHFEHGPRDTPTNAGGVDGFLFRTAARRDLREYWKTINVEQGGHFAPDDTVLAPYLSAVAAFAERAIPTPPPPTVDAAMAARGRVVFFREDTRCAQCHSGPSYTDSGQGNPSLDLAGPVRLWDVGTCNALNRNHEDFAGHPRGPCAFDTTALRGLWESAPYLHDGSARTLEDVLVARNVGDRHGRTSHLSSRELAELVEFLRSL
jgi:DNA-binding beta-propeller fold protein YncE